jgi:monomeric sarcosine oxidase
MHARYDHIVIGAGGLGSASAYWLGQRGEGTVLVLEQFELGHPWGASEDHSRIIRHSYHSPDYTALTPAMYETWRQVERQAATPLLTLPGCLDLAVGGTAGADELATYAHAMGVADIPYEELTAREIVNRWPEWKLPGDAVGIFHAEAGIIDIGRATAVHIALARTQGVEFLPSTPVRALEPRQDGIVVHTENQSILAGSVLVCAGSWTQPLLATAGAHLPLTLSQEQVTYFATPDPSRFAPQRWPIWIWHGDDFFYGFPVYGEVGVKAARDMRGRFVTQETRRWAPDPAEVEVVTDFLRQRLPAAVGPELRSRTCVYDMPPDRGFVIDHVPDDPRLLVAVGAGHAAKFASLIGTIMADLATTGQTDHPIEPFRFDRPAITDPDFVPTFRLSGATPG